MAIMLSQHLMSLTDQLRAQPVGKRVRASLGAAPVLDTTDAMAVWEPRRVVPMYGVPPGDFAAQLRPCRTPPPPADAPSVLGPVHFAWHFHHGRSFDVVVGDRVVDAAGFVPDDPDIGGRVVVEWEPFAWREEESDVVGHPHDPFKRLDVLRAGRHVVVSVAGTVLADSTRAIALYETHLPVRWYVPPADVRWDLLTPSDATTTCAYKGRATYFSLPGGDEGTVDLAWTYLDPLPEAAAVKDHLCFYAERTDLCVDGVDVPRPETLWSSRRSAELE